MSTIPISLIVSVNPDVLQAGGTGVVLKGLLLSTTARVPIGQVQPFANATDVGNYFGASSAEKNAADIYFAGFIGADVLPGSVLFAQYPLADVSAFLRGGSLVDMTLAELQAISGTLSVLIDGGAKAGSINLSGATSFSQAALLIEGTLDIEGPVVAAFTASIASTTMTVTAFSLGTGLLAVGQTIDGAGVTAGTYIVAQLTGPVGGAGTYTVSVSQTIGSESMTANAQAVAYDSVTNAFVINSGTDGATSTIAYATGATAAALKLTAATGAVASQGADAAEPEAFMDGITQVTEAWGTFALLFNPDESGNDNKYAFCTWVSGTNDQFGFNCWDPDVTPGVTVPDASCLGQRIIAAGLSGVYPVTAPDYEQAVFSAGIAASLDFTATNGRATWAFRRQSGLVATVDNETTANNFTANGYNYYGAFAGREETDTFIYDGHVSGPFLWMDSYINQIWLNSSFVEAMKQLLLNVKSLPYNTVGNTMIEAAAQSTINAGVNFGAIRGGVTLSEAQASEVNAAAGVRISDVLSTRGWYFQVKPATAEVRQARGTPPINFWYTDGQSVQRIAMSSVNIT